MQTRYTLHPSLEENMYHLENPIRISLVQSIGPKLPDIVEEAQLSLEETIGNPKGNSMLDCNPCSLSN
jgi:hypothetical protein